MKSVAIIGGGVTGLACAAFLLRGRSERQVYLFERSDRPGGMIQTFRSAGWVSEAGPCGLLVQQGAPVLQLIEQLGLTSDLIGAARPSQRRYIRIGGRLRSYPQGFGELAACSWLSRETRDRLLADPERGPRPIMGDPSVMEFAREHLGTQGADLLVEPLVAGIYAGNPDRLSARSALPRMFGGVEAGVPLSSLLVQASRPPGATGRRMASLKGGMNVLVDALRTNVGSALHLGTPVETLRREASGWGLALGGAAPRELSVDAVVLATPPPVSSSLVSTVRPELSRLLGAIPGAPVVVVSLGFATDDIRRPMDGFGYLVPRCEDGPVLGVQWASSMFPDMRSPSGHNLLQVFLGGSRASGICSLSDVELVTLACRELRTVLGVRDAPIHARVFRHGWGLPQYEVGHTLRLEAMRDQVAELRGLELAGNAFDGVGIPSCVESAYEAARGISEYLAGKGNAIRRAGRSRMPP